MLFIRRQVLVEWVPLEIAIDRRYPALAVSECNAKRKLLSLVEIYSPVKAMFPSLAHPNSHSGDARC